MTSRPTCTPSTLIRYPAIPRLAAVVAFEHHVHADGSGGFPQERRSGIPHLASQIVALADFYDTARNPTAAGPAGRPEDVLEAIRRETPRRFRPALVAGFPQALLAFELLGQH
jgi:HD-GYP domain-containing protein (c-di-GMP phosphodiesterase class II)